MAKTILQITQNILSKLDSDEANSVSDTMEAQQIAEIVVSIYTEIVVQYDLINKDVEFQLQDTSNPQNTVLELPESISRIDKIRYDVRSQVSAAPNYAEITYLDPDTFFKTQLNLGDGAEIETQELDSGTEYRVRNDTAPKYWTTIDQKTILFNSYDAVVDSSIQPSKTSCLGGQYDELPIADNTIIDLPLELSMYLEYEALELAFDLFGGGAPQKVRQLARKTRVRCQRNRDRLRQASSTGPNYGRYGGQTKRPVADISTGDFEPLPDYMKT